jgi:NhaP-type Na+/H+ and K+/H+ antiporter
MGKKSKLALSFIVIIFSLAILGISLNSMANKAETYNECTETKKNLDHNGEEISHLSLGHERNVLMMQHNANVDKYNLECA